MPPSDGERIATLEERMKALAGDVGELNAELGSSRDPTSLRGRLHTVEDTIAAYNIAGEARDALREAQGQLHRRRRVEIREWIATIIAVVSTIVAVLIAIHGG